MVKVYKFKQYQIYSNYEGGFIIHNVRKPFDIGHTHLNNFDTAKYLIKLAYYKRIPVHLSNYLIESLIRISDDSKYQNRIRSLHDTKNRHVKYKRSK